MDCSQFYSERDQRSRQYTGTDLMGVEKSIGVFAGHDVINTPSGQAMLLSLANLLTRAHRNITFVLPKAHQHLQINFPFNYLTVQDSLVNLCSSIDPCGNFRIVHEAPGGLEITIALGEHVTGSHTWYMGANRSVAYLSKSPCIFASNVPGTVRGAALASCLGANAIFRSSLRLGTAERLLSAWNYRENEDADFGPDDLKPINVGRVLMVGAGAVGSALAYWLHIMGFNGKWTIMDRDDVELHNTNRGLLFLPYHAGWPKGPALKKADIVAECLNARSIPLWYDQASETKETYDVILSLANERDVRTRIAHRNAPVVLHATTGENWLSQLHRHVAGHDDCIRCRTHDIRESAFECSTAPLPAVDNSESSDGALPFLSAASGLMLATALQRLDADTLLDERRNDWQWDFSSLYQMASGGIRRCQDGCSIWQPKHVRQKINEKTRWGKLDSRSLT